MATQITHVVQSTVQSTVQPAEATTDVAIVGGGMVGGTLALGLARQGFRVTVLEQAPPLPFAATPAPDVRVSAISQGSVALLEQLEVWPRVMALRCHPYQQLETWEWDSAHVHFTASQLAVPQLGYMVENNVLQWALWQMLNEHPLVTLQTTSHQVQMQTHICHNHGRNEQRQLIFNDGQRLKARLVVAADGANSQLRRQAGIGLYGWQYHQACLLITVRLVTPAGDTTWQQFTPDGPLAFLPLFDCWATLVWYQHPARIRQLQALTVTQLREHILAAFPSRLGDITPHAWDAFPLTRRHALRYVQPGFALLGDAAHTIHPLAGQGVNLGYRDVRTLLEVLTQARLRGEAWNSETVLQRYQRRRILDNHVMQSGMDLLYAGFSNNKPPLRLLRNLGLMAAQRAGLLKHQVLKYALGI